MSKHSAAVAAAAAASGNPHITSRDASQGTGHGTGKAPADTAGYNPTGNRAGAPYHSRQVTDDGTVTRQSGLTDNPHNPNDTDAKGVLGGDIVASTAPMIDSPTKLGSQFQPDRFGNFKATAVASVTQDTPAGQPVSFPDGGVLGRS